MNFYEVLNYFDRTRYFAAATNEEELLDMVDEAFVTRLQEITDDGGQYDDLRDSRKLRMDEITYELLLENVTGKTMQMKNLPGDLDKFYF